MGTPNCGCRELPESILNYINPPVAVNGLQSSTASSQVGVQQTTCPDCNEGGLNIKLLICLFSSFLYGGVLVDPLDPSAIKFSLPTGVLTVYPPRLRAAWNQFNAQYPTGSLQGYLTELATTITDQVSAASAKSFQIIVGSVILLVLILYIILCIVVMSAGIVGIGSGSALIFVGVLFAGLALIVTLTEASSFGTNAFPSFSSIWDPLVETTSCAVTAGTCCYTGGNCCCPGGTGATCEPIPPQIENIFNEIKASVNLV